MYVIIGKVHGLLLLSEKAAVLFVVALAQGLAEPLQGFLLLPVQVPGRLNGNGDILVAPAPAVKHRDALAPQPEHSAGLGALGDGILHPPIDGGDLQLRAQDDLTAAGG